MGKWKNHCRAQVRVRADTNAKRQHTVPDKINNRQRSILFSSSEEERPRTAPSRAVLSLLLLPGKFTVLRNGDAVCALNGNGGTSGVQPPNLIVGDSARRTDPRESVR